MLALTAFDTSISNHLLFMANIVIAMACTYACFKQGANVLISWVTTQSIMANLFVLKQIQLFTMNVTASDVFTISCMFSIALLEAFFGSEYAKKAITASCLSLIFFAVISQLHLHYQPSPEDFAQPAYQTLFGPNFRIILASIVAYWLSQQANLHLFRYLKKHATALSLQLKLIISVALAQLIDTITFAYLGLFGIVQTLFQIIIFSYTIKLITLSLLSNITLFLKRKAQVKLNPEPLN